MVQGIDLKGKVFEFLQKNNLMIEESQHSITNQNERHEEWMFRRDTPDDWSDEILYVADQPSRGYPILAPIERITDEEHPGGVFRFPHRWEMRTQQIEQLIKEQGTDALAWYRPFHMNLQEKWGITILDQGIWYVARKLAEKMYSKPYDVNQIQHCRNLALDFLYHHEMFHFKVELATTMMELINPSEPIYARYWNPQNHREWFGSEVKSHPKGKAPLEEALANSYAWDKIYSEYEKDERKVVKKAIKEFIKTQPDGYNHGFRLSVGGENWKAAMNELINKLLNATDDDILFSPHRTLLSHLFFNGGQGKEDWIDEYYEGIVPFRILETGFADGRFADSGKGLYLADFCMSKTCRGEYRKAKPRQVQADLQKAIYEWEHDEFASTLGKRKPRTGFKLKGHWNKHRGVSEVHLKGGGVAWRFYHEKFENGERIILRMHKKTVGKQDEVIKTISNKTRREDWRVKFHNKNCDVS